MKQEFITTTGKLIIDGDVLQLKYLKPRKNYDYYRQSFWLVIGMSLMKAAAGYFIVGLAGLVLLVDIVNFFYKNQWKNKFRLRNIKSIETVPDEFGLETKVVLYFRSNTSKEIDFRTSENQHEVFVQYIEQIITNTQLA